MLTEQKSQSHLPGATPVVLSALKTGGVVDEKKNTSSQRPSTPEALPTATTRCLRSAKLPTILYCLSLIIGFFATGLMLSSDARNENDVPGRAIYAFIFFIAAMLFDAGRIAKTSAAAVLDDVPGLEPADSPNEVKENTEEEEEKAEISTESPAPVEFQELKELNHAQSASVIEMKELKSNSREEKRVDDDSISRASSQAAHVSLSRSPTYLQRAIATGRELMPAVWAAQAFSLFMQNAVEEPANGLMPYTTLTGLAAGYAFHVSIKPWRLWGIRNWIFNNRNGFTVPEFIAIVSLLDFSENFVSLILSVTTAAFWTGYNTNDLSTGIFTTLFSRSIRSKLFQEEHNLTVEDVSFFPSIRRSLITVMSGASFMITSIMLLLNVREDSEGALNFGVQLLASIGGYLLTYPLGIYSSHYIPTRYRKNLLTICTYFLVPFAAPGLTIPHYMLLTGAGLCGGVAHSIISHRYYQQLARMEKSHREIEQLIKVFPQFFTVTRHLMLPADPLLQQEKTKHAKIKAIVNLFLIAYVLNDIFGVIASEETLKIEDTFSMFYIFNIFLSLNYLFPRFMPSVYRLQPLSNRLRFFYLDSFTLSFLTKVMVLLSYSALRTIWSHHGSFLDSKSLNSAQFYVSALFFLPDLFAIKAGFKRFFGGFIPYVPRSKQIDQLKVLQAPEKLKDHITAGNQTIRLSYHLFKFMQENCQNSITIVPTSDNNANSQPPEPIFLREAKSDDSQRCRHPWSSRMQWQAVPVVQPFSAPDPQALPSTAIATLHCGECQENILTCELGFDEEDRTYTRQRFNINFEFRLADAAIRGGTVASQFALGLPQGLSLSKDVTSFTL